jgi:hypothetical protein
MELKNSVVDSLQKIKLINSLLFELYTTINTLFIVCFFHKDLLSIILRSVFEFKLDMELLNKFNTGSSFKCNFFELIWFC